MDSNHDEFEDDIIDDISCGDDSKLPWYKVTILAMYVFSDSLQNSLPGVLENIHGKCTVCKKQISGRRTANTNFSRHFKSHPKEYKVFLEKVEEERMKRNSNSTKKRKICSAEESVINKKKILEEFFVKKKLPSNEQDVISGRILDYIVADARPLSTVDSPHFLKLIGSLNPRFQMFTRNSLAAMVVKEFNRYKDELMSMLCKVSTVCLTADAWSSQRRAFLGITIHWLDEVTLTRYSRALALKRFFGSQTYSRISGFISSIIQEYQLEGKVQHIVTDNGLNFVKAVKDYFQTKASEASVVVTETNDELS
ncbi:Uncharacterized protein APZ42_005102, partial [Daphnia magna]